MEYKKIINLLDNTPSQPTKFRTENWVEINNDSRGTCNINSQIKFETSMLRSRLCDYNDAYILAKGTISMASQAGDNPYNANQKVVFKNCALSTDCISEINNTEKDNAKHTDVIISTHNLKEYSNNYSKTSRSLQQYYRDETALTDARAIANFHAVDNSAQFKFNKIITGVVDDNGRKNLEIVVQLKYLSNFSRTLEVPLISCETNLILTWSDKYVLSNDTKA